MKSNFERESLCEFYFREAGTIWHLWTREDFPVVFSTREEFMAGMNIIGLAARLYPKVKIYTFELMSNHLHIVAAGQEADVKALFELIKKLLVSHFNGGRYLNGKAYPERFVDLSGFNCNMRCLNSVADVRNVIAYDNRNGYLVSPDESPFSYPWGANRYYFNPDAKHYASTISKYLTIQERRDLLFSHIADKIPPLKKVYGYACPLDFCHIEEGERLFASASQYFYLISRSVESYKAIAAEISESVFYTDDELYSTICSLARKQYSCKLSDLDKTAKTELARTMHFDYNAGNKQICRILKLPPGVVDTLFP